MDEGRIAGTADIWDATQLTDLNDVAGISWECPGCTLGVFPIAWRPGRHRVTAYFSRKRGMSHHPRCKYDLLCRSGPNALGPNEMGDPEEWISKISFPSRTLKQPLRPPIARVRQAVTPVSHSSTRHSISAACTFHHAIKGSRYDWPLEVAGVAGSNYYDVFRPAGHLPDDRDEVRIWFAGLHVTSKLSLTGDRLHIALHPKIREEHVFVEVDMVGWTDDQRMFFVDRLEAARDAAR